jgi:Protein of unknown function (DUF1579)
MATKLKETSPATDISAGRVGESLVPGREQKALNLLIGNWMTEGSTVADRETPPMNIVASDVYEWAPGGFFVVHSAFGRIGETGAGGIEIIGYDRESGTYQTHFFDNQGNRQQQELKIGGDSVTWLGEKTRCKATISPDGTVMTAHHERSEDGAKWTPSMEVTLTKVT